MTNPSAPSQSPSLIPAVVTEAALAAGVAFLLTLPLVGFRTLDLSGRMELGFRPLEVAVAVLLVFLGRAAYALTRRGYASRVLAVVPGALGLTWALPFPTHALGVIAYCGIAVLGVHAFTTLFRAWGWRAHLPRTALVASGVGTAALRFGQRWFGTGLLLAAFAFPFLPFSNRSVLDIAIQLLTYIMLGWGLNIVVGLAGLLDLGYVAFYAVGAYAYGLLAFYWGLGFWLCLPLAGLLAALSGLVLGFPVLRLRGDYFAIVTLGFGEIIRIILINWDDFTQGPRGISDIPRPSFFGLAEFVRNPPAGTTAFHQMVGIPFDPVHRIIFLYYLILILALGVNLFTKRIRRLPLGRAWEALREDDIACAALGIDRTKIKLAAFAVAAMFGGFAGSFFATRQGFISPESFTFMESALILAIVVLGGMGSQAGVVVATLVVVGLPEMFREFQSYRMLAFGAGMVAIMLWRPRGLLSHREPTLRLHPRGSDPTAGEAGPREAVP